MLFNSLHFLLFFPCVCIVYWLIGGGYKSWQNGFLLVASYYFYMNWEPAYALLIVISTVSTWGFARMMERREDKRRKLYLLLCLLINFSILFVYKYLNFATESIFSVLSLCGLRMEMPRFELLLPVGISFYTFQAVGYTIDVYRRNISAERNLLTYALFVSFFPQLVAGPIERARNLLPQFHNPIKFDADECIEGLKLMIWGYFMKLCIAENVASYVNAVFNNLEHHNGTSVLMATFFFTFQIYCDFCGYSLIAIGAARCMGYKLMTNFNHPYLTRSMKDFWRRWHISLSTWFMDYVYIPLGGSRCSSPKHYRNLFLTLLLSGVWHGANWTFIFWGGYHGILLVLSTMRLKWLDRMGKTKKQGSDDKADTRDCDGVGVTSDSGSKPPDRNRLQSFSHAFVHTLNILCGSLICFILAMFGWIFFRANSLGDAFLAINKIFTEHGMLFNGAGKPAIALPVVLIVLMMFREMKDEYHWRVPSFMHSRKNWLACASTAAVIIVILLCASFEGGQFIYFQF